jgi:branched-chain amino acid transport system permease protein
VLFLLPEFLGDIVGRRYILIYGLLVVLALMFQPNGLIGLYDQLRHRLARRP